MTVLTLMAIALDDELQARGYFGLGRADCQEIIAAVIERTAEVGRRGPIKPAKNTAPDRDP